MVYFFQGIETGYIKIGNADDVRRRLQELTSPDILICLAVIKEAYNDAHYHQRFRHLWSHGEWFRPGEDLLKFITKLPRNEYTDLLQETTALGIDTGWKTRKPPCYHLPCGTLLCTVCNTPLPKQQKRIREVWSPAKDSKARQILAREGMNRCHHCYSTLPDRSYWHAFRWRLPESKSREGEI
jgi:hypothetical protein